MLFESLEIQKPTFAGGHWVRQFQVGHQAWPLWATSHSLCNRSRRVKHSLQVAKAWAARPIERHSCADHKSRHFCQFCSPLKALDLTHSTRSSASQTAWSPAAPETGCVMRDAHSDIVKEALAHPEACPLWAWNFLTSRQHGMHHVKDKYLSQAPRHMYGEASTSTTLSHNSNLLIHCYKKCKKAYRHST